MEDSYKKLLAFLREAEKLKSTLRHNWTTSGRQEDSSQHSWRAGVFFIIANDIWNFDVDPYKTLVMLTLHDLPEVKHGDIAAFVKDTDAQKHAEHKRREKQAAHELYAMLPEPLARKYTALQEEFDRGQSNEARVAKAIEKIESQLQHLESGPQYWSDEERGQHMLHYPDAAIDALDNEHVRAIWAIVYKDIYDLTYPDAR